MEISEFSKVFCVNKVKLLSGFIDVMQVGEISDVSEVSVVKELMRIKGLARLIWLLNRQR